MKNLANTRIVFAPVRRRIVNWTAILAILGSVAVTLFIILCAAKAVRP